MTNLTSHPIRTDEEYRRVMSRIHVLAANDPVPSTSEGDELEVLSLLIRSFEDQHYPIAKPSLREAIEFRAEQMNLSPTALDSIFGGRGRRSEVLSGKRELSKKLAARLKNIGVPDSLLLHMLIGTENSVPKSRKTATRNKIAKVKRRPVKGTKRSTAAHL